MGRRAVTASGRGGDIPGKEKEVPETGIYLICFLVLAGAVNAGNVERGGAQMTGKRKEMTAGAAKAILQDKDRRLEGIERKVMLLQKEMMSLKDDGDGLILAAAMPPKLLGMPPGRRGHMDNADVLLRYYRQRQQRMEEISAQIWELSEETEEIRRLWSCFLALPEPYYEILEGMYVAKRLYTDIEKSYGYSHSVFENKRKEGLDLLVEMFKSEYSSLELMRAAHLWDKKKREGSRRRDAASR